MIVSQLYQEWRRFQPSGNRARKKVTVPAPEMADTALNGAKIHRWSDPVIFLWPLLLDTRRQPSCPAVPILRLKTMDQYFCCTRRTNKPSAGLGSTSAKA